MKITHRALADASAILPLTAEPAATYGALGDSLDKAPRFSCCCRLSELLPLVRQLHDAARAARAAETEQPGVAA